MNNANDKHTSSSKNKKNIFSLKQNNILMRYQGVSINEYKINSMTKLFLKKCRLQVLLIKSEKKNVLDKKLSPVWS